MPQQQEEWQPEFLRDAKGCAAVFIYLAHCWAAVMHLVLRVPGTCGKDYFGMQAFLGWLWLLLYTELFFPKEPGAIYVWYTFLAIIPLLIIHRLAAIKARRNGKSIHSYYVGDSWLQRLMPFLKPSSCKPGLEQLVCFLGGVALLPLSVALGSFVILGGFANAVALDLIQARDRRKVDAMEDALIEQQYLSEALQERLKNRERR